MNSSERHHRSLQHPSRNLRIQSPLRERNLKRKIQGKEVILNQKQQGDLETKNQLVKNLNTTEITITETNREGIIRTMEDT